MDIYQCFIYIVTKVYTLHLYMPPHSLKVDYDIVSIQYANYMKNIFTDWNWGKTSTGKDVWDVFLYRVPYTLKVNFTALFFYVPVGLALGSIATLKKNIIIEYLINLFTLIFSSIPGFVMMFLLVLVFGYGLALVPPLFPADYAPLKIRILGYILPIAALSSEALAIFSRLMRGELSENLNDDFKLLVKTQGLNARQAFFRHSLRNVMVPILPVMATTFLYIMGQAFFMERIYDIPGIAMWFFSSTLEWYSELQQFKVRIDTNLLVIICGFYVNRPSNENWVKKN